MMAGKESFEEFFDPSKIMEEGTKRTISCSSSEENKEEIDDWVTSNLNRCEATHLFDEEVEALFTAQSLESSKRALSQQQRLAEAMQKETELSQKLEDKIDQLKLAQKQQKKLEKAMLLVEKRDRENNFKPNTITTTTKEAMTQSSSPPKISRDSTAAVLSNTAKMSKLLENRQLRWRQLLAEANKQAKYLRDTAEQEFRLAETALRQARSETLAESSRQKTEAKLRTDTQKRDLFTKYTEARAFQRILEKEEETRLEQRQEREEFFAGKRAVQHRRHLMEVQDKFAVDRKGEELRERVEKAERLQRNRVLKYELKVQAQENHRLLYQKYELARAKLDAVATSYCTTPAERRKFSAKPGAGAAAVDLKNEPKLDQNDKIDDVSLVTTDTGDDENDKDANFVRRLFSAFLYLVRRVLGSCSGGRRDSI